jgi:hypothetical protein
MGRLAVLGVSTAVVDLSPGDAQTRPANPTATALSSSPFRAAGAQLAQVKLARNVEPITRFEA